MKELLLSEGVVEVGDYYWGKLSDFIRFYQISLIGALDGEGKGVLVCQCRQQSFQIFILHVIKSLNHLILLCGLFSAEAHRALPPLLPLPTPLRPPPPPMPILYSHFIILLIKYITIAS